MLGAHTTGWLTVAIGMCPSFWLVEPRLPRIICPSCIWFSQTSRRGCGASIMASAHSTCRLTSTSSPFDSTDGSIRSIRFGRCWELAETLSLRPTMVSIRATGSILDVVVVGENRISTVHTNLVCAFPCLEHHGRGHINDRGSLAYPFSLRMRGRETGPFHLRPEKRKAGSEGEFRPGSTSLWRASGGRGIL